MQHFIYCVTTQLAVYTLGDTHLADEGIMQYVPYIIVVNTFLKEIRWHQFMEIFPALSNVQEASCFLRVQEKSPQILMYVLMCRKYTVTIHEGKFADLPTHVEKTWFLHIRDSAENIP